MTGIRIVSLVMVLFSLLPLQAAESKPARPNVVIILADDMGFSDAGCYGGEIATPHLDKLAAGGLRFTQFYNTGRCWPTRASILSGYYAPQVRMDPPRGRLPEWTQLLSHRLKPAGYRSYHAGKWHIMGAPGPVADGGFDRSYRFDDWDRYFSPTKHWEDDVLAPPVLPDSGYYATTAFTDRAIAFLQEHADHHADKPFFLYLAFIAPHFPLHALPEDIVPYQGTYDEGWQVVRQRRWERMRTLGIVRCDLSPPEPMLSPRYFQPQVLETLGPGEVRFAVPWEELTDQQRQFQAMKMSLHAAMITRMDLEIGRLIQQLRAMEAWEDTLVLFLSDNGADATMIVRGDGHDRDAEPGSWQSFLCLGPGWATVGNTPFRRHKVWVHEGGIATPLIAHWPRGITARGQLRHDVGHVVDFAPTLLELAGLQPAPSPGAPAYPGRSLVPAFARDGSLARDEVFFHHEGNRALRIGDYKLVSAREDDDRWELFHLATDRGEQHDLAAAQPDRVRDMAARWQRLQDEYTRDAGLESPQP
jgi:arylsulfatase A-like enzyme